MFKNLLFRSCKISSSPWKAAFKKTKVKLELLIHIDILLLVEIGVREGICHAIHRYAKVSNKYMKDYDKIKIMINDIFLELMFNILKNYNEHLPF